MMPFKWRQSVTLGDEEARKRKVQKTILERKGPPTFTCAVEMISKTDCRVYHRLDTTVDTILAGNIPTRFQDVIYLIEFADLCFRVLKLRICIK